MESEWTEISQNTSGEIDQTKQKKGRVIAVGTTTTRALESFSNPEGRVVPGADFLLSLSTPLIPSGWSMDW